MLVHLVLHDKQVACGFCDEKIYDILVFLRLQKSVFFQKGSFRLDINGGDTQIVCDLVDRFGGVADAIAYVLRQCRAEKLVQRFFADRTVDSDGIESYRIEFEFTCFSHGLHTSFQFFFRFKQVPFDRAERNVQFGCNIGLFAVFKIIRDDNPSLQLGQISNLALHTCDCLLRIVICVIGRSGKHIRQLVDRNPDDLFGVLTVVVAQRVVRHCPNKFADIADIVLDQKRAECTQNDLLREILRVVCAFATFERKAENGLGVFRNDALGSLSVHLFVPRFESFHPDRRKNRKRLAKKENFFAKTVYCILRHFSTQK